jgi:hypothetical protein
MQSSSFHDAKLNTEAAAIETNERGATIAINAMRFLITVHVCD